MTVEPTALRSIAQAAKDPPFSEPSIRGKIARGEVRVVKIADYIYIEEAKLRRLFGALYNPRPARP